MPKGVEHASIAIQDGQAARIAVGDNSIMILLFSYGVNIMF
jgi:hypothetical protein